MKKNLIFALGLSLVTGFTACSSEIEDGTTDIDSWEMPYEEVVAKYTYTHPCAMFNDADFTMADRFANGTFGAESAINHTASQTL